ncbi:MAG: hypothetical protein ACJ72U_05950, partial [Nitrososphaeraceae archaeon]
GLRIAHLSISFYLVYLLRLPQYQLLYPIPRPTNANIMDFINFFDFSHLCIFYSMVVIEDFEIIAIPHPHFPSYK